MEGEKKESEKRWNSKKRCEINILIFDIDGGTFDLSVLEVKDLVFIDKGKFGDTHFSREDFDNALVDYCIEKFYEIKKIKIDKNNDSEEVKRIENGLWKCKKNIIH